MPEMEAAEGSDWDEDDDLSELAEIGDGTRTAPFMTTSSSTGSTTKAKGMIGSIAASIESQLLVC